VHIPPDPIVLLGDNKLPPRLLSTLIDNAVKYTSESGAIRIGLESQADGSVQLRVQDTGAGIPPELLPKIFDRFCRGASVRNRDQRRSVSNEGSTFTVLFPGSITRVPSPSDESKMELIGG
jgi:signal transduction histidine kinase